MNEIQKFKDIANKATEANDIDELCLDWLRYAANEHPEKTREMMMSAIAIIAKGLE